MLTTEQIAFYEEHGYLHIPQMFTPAEMDELERDLDYLMDAWAQTEMGWTGPWRLALMDAETERKSKLTALHDLQLYAASWLRAVTNAKLTGAMTDLLGEDVELHHTTLHAKPPETGRPFPLHQDNAFYEHTDNRYVDVLVHLDDTRHENGEIRFLAGSHKLGYLPHITQTADGPCTPHLDTAEYRLEDSVAVPAKRGDVVCFNILCVHGSYINQTKNVRRMVRCGYRDPANAQLSGQSMGRPGIMVSGRRLRDSAAQPLVAEQT